MNKMKKRIIVTEAQLKAYVERKKAEKVFASILSDMQRNSKYLNENMSLTKANELVIDKYKSENKITEHVEKLLKEYGIVDDKGLLT